MISTKCVSMCQDSGTRRSHTGYLGVRQEWTIRHSHMTNLSLDVIHSLSENELKNEIENVENCRDRLLNSDILTKNPQGSLLNRWRAKRLAKALNEEAENDRLCIARLKRYIPCPGDS